LISGGLLILRGVSVVIVVALLRDLIDLCIFFIVYLSCYLVNLIA
jgi:hypothetical protein